MLMTVSAQVTPMMCTEKRPWYAQPRATNAADIAARKNSAGSAGTSRSRGTPMTASGATAAPNKTGSDFQSNCGGSRTVTTISTLSIHLGTMAANGIPGCHTAKMFRDVPPKTLNDPL
jgi:hypothetical protein